MWLLWIVLIIGAITLVDWLAYKYIKGNPYRDREVKIGKHITIYAGHYNLGFYFGPEYNDHDYMMLIMHTMWHDIFIRMPWWKAKRSPGHEWRFGFYLYNDNSKKLFHEMVLMWGFWDKTIYMPWSFYIYRTTIEGQGGERYTSLERYDFKLRNRKARKYNSYALPLKETYTITAPGLGFCWTEPYTYTLKSGEVQETTAWYHIEQREWRRLWLMWCPLFNLIRTDLCINLKNEIGEQVGSWKGGVTGFSRPMLPGETPQDAYQRIMKEAVFK